MTRDDKTLPITVLIAAKNEAANLPKCLGSLPMMERVIVIDSHSTDESEEIVRNAGAEFISFRYSGHYPKKRQWALGNCDIQTPWVLFIDADEEMTKALAKEIQTNISRSDAPESFLITKGFHFMGRKFRFGGFSHSAVLLLRHGKGRFEKMDLEETSGMDMEVHERLLVDGRVERLSNPLVHKDYKGLQAYIDRHNRYSSWEAAVRRQLLLSGHHEDQLKPSLFGNLQQKRRWLKMLAMKMPFEHWLWFFYHYFFRLGILEGRRGLIASQIRKQYISNVRAKMFEKKIL